VEGEQVTIRLSSDQALVLYELLSRFDQEEELSIEDRAEERVLGDVHAQLEKALVAPFDPRYEELVAAARDRLRG
jgi:hypothetical protein